MKIATWNVERPLKASPKNREVLDQLRSLDADIYILTETNEAIQPFNDYYGFSTSALEAPYYKDGERRTMIWCRYPAVRSFSTYDEQTAVCVQLLTPLGELTVYGTVMGVFGNRRPDYTDEVVKQLEDIKRISTEGNLCIAGDMNMTFRDDFYHTSSGRKLLVDGFAALQLKNLTYDIAKNLGHIVVSEAFIAGRKARTGIPINTDYQLSDHIGVMAEIV